MALTINNMIQKIDDGGYTRKQMIVLRDNAIKKGGPDSSRIVLVCEEALEKSQPKKNARARKSLEPKRTVWWLAIDSNNGHSSYSELKERKVVAQGWHKLGDLSVQLDFKYKMNKAETNDAIIAIGDRVFPGEDHWKHNRKPGAAPRVFWNLLNMREGDLVVAIEGTTVKGVCELNNHGIDGYSFDEGHRYAHGFGGEVDWVDWDVDSLGNPPTAPGQSVKGVAKLNNEASHVMKAWEALNLAEA